MYKYVVVRKKDEREREVEQLKHYKERQNWSLEG